MQSRGKVCKRPAGAFMNTPFTAWRRPHAQGREQEKAEGRPLFPSRRRRDWGCGGKAPAKQLNITKISVSHTRGIAPMAATPSAAAARGQSPNITKFSVTQTCGNAVSGRNVAQAVARAQLAASRRAFKSAEHLCGQRWFLRAGMQSRGKVCKRPAGAFMNTPFTAWRRPHAQGREQEKAEGRPLFPSRRRRDWGCGGKAPTKTVIF